MSKDSPLNKWLATQPKDFIVDVNNNDTYGDSYFTVDKLRELDNKHNPEGDSNDRHNQ